jgi:cob(I)alamin adenosyltransferase
MKIYTKTGDGGTTALIGGERVSKADARVEAYGTVDELAAHLAMLSDMMSGDGRLGEMVVDIRDIQGDLMTVEAMLATGRGGEGKIVPLPDSAVARLERQIDRMSEGLPPLKGFVIPGGHPAVSQAHICRTVCRRAERAAIRVSDEASEHGHPRITEAARYLNRLSDWLYVVGRKIVTIFGLKETYWIA